MKQVLLGFLSVGGVCAAGLLSFLIGWGFFKGLAAGVLVWIIVAIIMKVKGTKAN